MNDWFLPLCLALVLMVTLTGCQVFADIFQAGFWVGIIATVVLIGLIFFIIRLISSASR